MGSFNPVVTGNQKSLHEDVRDWFTGPEAQGEPSVWIAFTLDGMSSRILPKSSHPFPAVAFRNA